MSTYGISHYPRNPEPPCDFDPDRSLSAQKKIFSTRASARPHRTSPGKCTVTASGLTMINGFQDEYNLEFRRAQPSQNLLVPIANNLQTCQKSLTAIINGSEETVPKWDSSNTNNPFMKALLAKIPPVNAGRKDSLMNVTRLKKLDNSHGTPK